MRKFRCYKCGAVLSVEDGVSVAVCPACGAKCACGVSAPTVNQAAVQNQPQMPVQNFAPVQNAAQVQNVAPKAVAVAPSAQGAQNNAVQPAPQQAQGVQNIPAVHSAAQPVVCGGTLTSDYAEKIMIANSLLEYVPRKQRDTLLNSVMNAPLQQARKAAAANVKSPKTTLYLSLFLFFFGADRMYSGYVGLGICKLFFGVATFFIWNFVDVFVAHKDARKKNLEKIMMELGLVVNTKKPKKEKK